ncbi:MAG: AAA family ATPase [Bacteriovoracaceae bacterium]|nr:AAA family ATPase [Bacteriovoracaceae bacterium]
MTKNIGRYLVPVMNEFLENRMVFVGGPRQVGKTTMCLSFLRKPTINSEAYLNWDDLPSRDQLKNAILPVSEKIICIDEIHKYKLWRSLIKGMYDKKKNIYKFIVTGSARLDHYRKEGDSLLGRYRYLRLHPLSLGELKKYDSTTIQLLLKFGGFPEPFFNGTEKNWKLWQRERSYRIIYDDIRDLERVKEISSLELLADALPQRVGSPLSINNLSQDLEAHHATMKNWLQILDNVYFSFRIPPFGAPKLRAVKKEQKLYLWDWSSIEDIGIKFENMVASQLLKYCHFLEDSEGEKMELRFLRDHDKREIDFVVLKNKIPIFAVECKTGERSLSPHIKYFQTRTSIKHFYQVHLGTKHQKIDDQTTIIPFGQFCKELNLP